MGKGQVPTPLFRPSLKAHPCVCVPLRHIGQNDLVSDLQAFEDLDGGDRTFSQLYWNSNCRCPVIDELEETHLTVFLTLNGPADVHDIFEPLNFNRSVHCQIRARPFREPFIQRHIDGYRTVVHGWIHSNHMAVDDAVSGINF